MGERNWDHILLYPIFNNELGHCERVPQRQDHGLYRRARGHGLVSLSPLARNKSRTPYPNNEAEFLAVLKSQWGS